MTTESVSAEALLRLHRDSVLNTPWGPAQTAEHIGGECVSVTTAGHGGILLSGEAWMALPAEVRACLFADDGWAEEDCDAPIVLAVLVDKGIVGIEHMPWLGDGDEGKANLYNVARRVAAGFPQYNPCLEHLPAVPPAPPEGGSGEAAGSLVISRLNEATEIEWSTFIQMDEGERLAPDRYLDDVLSREIDELREALTVGQGQLRALEAEAAKRGIPNPPAGGEDVAEAVVDLEALSHGIVMRTEAGREWLLENVGYEDWQLGGHLLAIEPRMIGDILEGAQEAGLSVR